MSDVKTPVVKNTKTGISVSPNPTMDVANLSFENATSESLDFILTDANGKVIKNQTYSAVKGRNMLTFDMKELSSGIYYISCQQNAGFTQKVIKQ